MPTTRAISLRLWFEGLLIIIALIFCLLWLKDPQGPFEPVIAMCSLLSAVFDYWYRSRNVPADTKPTISPTVASQVVEISRPSTLPAALQQNEVAPMPLFTESSPAAFFASRFSAAFPGIRDTTWFSGSEAVERLSILLAQPLTFVRPFGSTLSPIWWLRGGNSHIDSFSKIDRRTVLMNRKELLVDKIAAVYSAQYKRLFVYVACASMPPSGAYEWTPEKLNSFVNDFGYAWEEYGLYRGAHVVSRAEYDDRATNLLGKVVQMDSDLELRVRYLTPYNFVLVAHDSPINNYAFDEELERRLNELLRSPDQLADLRERIKSLPSSHATW